MANAKKTEQEEVYECPAKCKPAEDDRGKCGLLIAAYILAGLAMMLNIRLSYSSAPYALIRFKLPENLFSVFVRRMASSLELWCLPGFIIADGIELAIKLEIGRDFTKFNNLDSKELKYRAIIVPSIIAQWLNFLTYVILFFVYLAGDDQGHLTTFYWTIAVSGFVFGINNVFVFAADYNYIPIYIAGENCFPALTSFIHYITTLTFGNRRKYDSDFLIVFIDILVAIIISLAAAIVWTIAYGFCKDSGPFDGKITYTTTKDIKSIIVTGITTNNKVTKTVNITTGTVTITTYNQVPKGTCNTGTHAATLNLAGATAKITPPKDGKGATLDIDITTAIATNDNADDLNALAHLAIPLHDCNVNVDHSKNQVTITSGTFTLGKDKCIKTEITLTIPDLTDLDLTGGNTATVKVAPPPNHLKIKYKTTTGPPVKKEGAVAKTEDMKGKGMTMTAITEAIAKEIKDTATDENSYYPVTLRKSKIRYYFKLKDNTEASKLAAGAEASIIVQYGHIFAEGFSGTYVNPAMISPLLIVIVGMD